MSRFLEDLKKELAAKDARARAEGLPARGDTEDMNVHHYRGASEREADGILRECFTCTGWAVGVHAHHCQRIAHCVQEIEMDGTCDFWKRDAKRCPVEPLSPEIRIGDAGLLANLRDAA